MQILQEKIPIPDLNTNAASRRMCGELPVSSLSVRPEGAAPALFYAFPSARSGKSESGSLRFQIPGDRVRQFPDRIKNTKKSGDRARQFPDQTKNTQKSGDRARQFPATNPRKIRRKDHSYDVAAIRRTPSPDGCRMIRSSRVGRGRPGRPYTGGQP